MHAPHPSTAATALVGSDDLRTRFSSALSAMYRQEVPQYGTLVELVADTNARTLQAQPALRAQLERTGETARLGVERHGAIRVGSAQELATLRRLFALMGMEPVGYYDLSVAGVPVHSTAFRPVTDAALLANPFRVFTSLLRLELVDDPALRAKAAAILSQRRIFTPRLLELIARGETQGGLDSAEADDFVQEALHTFRWHSEATVDAATYDALQKAHRLVADVVCFKGPHINHLTPRTLDIDAAQAAMPLHGMDAKEVVEGPPRRDCPILLRQTSFKALQEPVRFVGDAATSAGAHTARFGEIEQRGVALTRKGRALYDQLLAQAQGMKTAGNAVNAGNDAQGYAAQLAEVFQQFPDTHAALRSQGLAFYRYTLATPDGAQEGNSGEKQEQKQEHGQHQQQQQPQSGTTGDAEGLQALLERGRVQAEPITYEDFLPVSAAGIFQSNLGGQEQKHYQAHAAQQAFEDALGAPVHDEIALYEAAQQQSIDRVLAQLRGQPGVGAGAE